MVLGIRGTDFEANVQPDGSGSVVLYFGQLEITEKKSGFTFLLNAGEKVTFGVDGSITRPIKINKNAFKCRHGQQNPERCLRRRAGEYTEHSAPPVVPTHAARSYR